MVAFKWNSEERVCAAGAQLNKCIETDHIVPEYILILFQVHLPYCNLFFLDEHLV